MHGPYTATATIRRSDGTRETLALDRDLLAEGDAVAWRYYNSHHGHATMLGATRAAALAVALLIEPGDEADIEIVGRVGTEGRDARDERAGYQRVRRDERGRAFLTLGCRFAERHWKGL